MDPLAEQFPGWNPYHYVHNNPINLIDPTGMSAQEPGEGGGWWSRIWNASKNTIDPSSKEEDMTILDEIVIIASGQNKEDRIKQKQINKVLNNLKFEETKQEWRDIGIWDDNASYNNWGHAVGSQLGLIMPSARFNGLYNVFSKNGINTSGSNVSTVIHGGKQGKHIVGHNNYQNGKSVLTQDAQGLLNNFHSGSVKSVQTINNVKTRVDFGKVIGQYVNPQTGGAFPTTKGIIINSKTGAHIVPSTP